jgi:ribosomal protein L7/L12
MAFGVILVKMAAMGQRFDRLYRLEANVDALLKHEGVTFDPFQNVPTDVRDALARGQTIDAIKRYRQASGVDLKDARDFIDELRRRTSAGS